MRIDPVALREAREAKGINRSELSRRAGFKSRNYAHRLEEGTRGTNVSAETLDGLAKALEVEPGDLLLADQLADDPEEVSSATPTDEAPPDGGPAVHTATGEPEPNPEAWRWG